MDPDADENSSKSRFLEERSPLEANSFSTDPGTHSGVVPTGPSPSLLASLQSLVEDNDHMLFPQSLHQIAEGFFLEEDYKWAVKFLHLEKVYHERLLSNLTYIQEKWESLRKARLQPERDSSSEANGSDRDMEVLSHICRTHQRPTLCQKKKLDDKIVQKYQTYVRGNKRWKPEQAEETSHLKDEEALQFNDEDFEDEWWNEELLGDSDIDSQVPVEELESPIQVEEIYPCTGLVSILKKNICDTEADHIQSQKYSTQRKVHFREPDSLLDQEESSKNSCLKLLLMCLVTVMFSLGGTALYCLFGEAYSNVCVDFSQNMEFYFGPVRQTVDILSQWF